MKIFRFNNLAMHNPPPLSRFWRTIQALNTLILFTVGLLALGVLGYGAIRILKDQTAPRTVSEVINPLATPDQTKVSLVSFSSLVGTPYLMAELSADQTTHPAYYDKTATSVRNYLFFNTQDRSSRWLLPNNQNLILNVSKLGTRWGNGFEGPEPQSPGMTGEMKQVKGLLFTLVKADTDGDKRLTQADRQTLALADASGAGYTEVLGDIELVLSTYSSNPQTVLVFYQAGGKFWVSTFNLPQRRRLETRPLAAPPAGSLVQGSP